MFGRRSDGNTVAHTRWGLVMEKITANYSLVRRGEESAILIASLIRAEISILSISSDVLTNHRVTIKTVKIFFSHSPPALAWKSFGGDETGNMVCFHVQFHACSPRVQFTSTYASALYVS
jgi:hypothetical protein